MRSSTIYSCVLKPWIYISILSIQTFDHSEKTIRKKIANTAQLDTKYSKHDFQDFRYKSFDSTKAFIALMPQSENPVIMDIVSKSMHSTIEWMELKWHKTVPFHCEMVTWQSVEFCQFFQQGYIDKYGNHNGILWVIKYKRV